MKNARSSSNLDGFEQSLRAAYGAFETEPTSTDRKAVGDLSPVSLGPFEGFRIRAQAVRSIRPALGDKWIGQAFILMPLAGDLVVHHYDRQIRLNGGDMVLMDSRAPCMIDAPSRNRSVVLGTPREMIAQLRSDADHLYAVPVSGQRGVGRMLSAMIQTLADDDSACDARDSAVTLSVTMALLDRALGDRQASTGARRSRAEATIERMGEWVMANGHDPDLDLDMLAARFGLSRRSLYRLFAETGITPGKWLRGVRLDQARRWLMSGDPLYRSVGQVAFAAGFNDSSHFARSFKRRFGVLPGDLLG